MDKKLKSIDGASPGMANRREGLRALEGALRPPGDPQMLRGLAAKWGPDFVVGLTPAGARRPLEPSLNIAIERRLDECALALLELGADPRLSGKSGLDALGRSAVSGNAAWAGRLLELNKQDPSRFADPKASKALWRAVKARQVECVKILTPASSLAARWPEEERHALNADVRLSNALMAAAAGGHLQCLKALLAAGANPSDAQEKEEGAFGLACVNGQEECAKALLAACPELAHQKTPIGVPIMAVCAGVIPGLGQPLTGLFEAMVEACDIDRAMADMGQALKDLDDWEKPDQTLWIQMMARLESKAFSNALNETALGGTAVRPSMRL